jgi:hypothetical protein
LEEISFNKRIELPGSQDIADLAEFLISKLNNIDLIEIYDKQDQQGKAVFNERLRCLSLRDRHRFLVQLNIFTTFID